MGLFLSRSAHQALSKFALGRIYIVHEQQIECEPRRRELLFGGTYVLFDIDGSSRVGALK
jgi:hypothetical protein